ncbi:GNAT family protein [Kamptonema sp. UHCC 0994]|uniref:GNAT family N-acetyltransferase n=1 Tax=Kamptonema sp. UHCC 0994 TaxID=3031329 RepID=UPI0023BA830C|nr:GNAT family protein [Kamptonema sp. UHCC 0994]MDF0556226.1 GNAT family protein [Kamptonema sp. UHCC 0994]
METQDIFRNLTTLETERLILRKMTLEDAEDMFEYASDPEVAKYTIWNAHQSVKDTKFFLNTVVERYKNRQITDWGIIHKEDGKFIGTCGFAEYYLAHNRAEIGYVLSRKYWKQGYMSEAVGAIIKFGFQTMKLNRIEARCEVENIASARVMEKVGMEFEGILRQHIFTKGKYCDLKIYSILRQDFFGKKYA